MVYSIPMGSFTKLPRVILFVTLIILVGVGLWIWYNPSVNNQEQAVIVYISNQLPKDIYDNYDLSTIEDKLIERIENDKVGEFDGHEIGFGDERAVLYMYGPDAEKLFASIKSELSNYPLTKKSRVIIRYGGPGTEQREEIIQE